MTQRVSRSILVRRPHDEVAAFATDPHQVLDVVPGFARFAVVGADAAGADEGSEEWDVFLEIGTLQVGGRVQVSRPTPTCLEWRAERGTRHRFRLEVAAAGDRHGEAVDDASDASEVTMTLEYSLSGLLMARASEVLARGIVSRHLEAGLQEIRHHLEHGDVLPA